MPIKIIIFDLDGTLVDSSIDITNAINYAIKSYGIKPLAVQETISLVGEGITRLIEKVIEKNQGARGDSLMLKGDKEILIQRFLEHYSSHIVDNTALYPHVSETLISLNDYRKAVISNKRESLSEEILDKLGILSHFDLVVGSDTTAEKKPSPLPIQYVLRRLDFKPEEAAIVGDSNLDIEAGKAAGIKTIAVTYGYRPAEMLGSADYAIDRMDKLIEILRSGMIRK
ncbi:MAG: HAD-IA family hydrolase [Nitrospirae bacterium]|nr:HAD-IA family hydrolase [Nitrospirota bacterium]